MNLKEILQGYKDKTGYNNDILAAKLGVTKSAVSKWLSGQVKKVKPETMERISALVGYDIAPFLKGQVVRFKKPILGYVKAGYDLFREEQYLGYEEVNANENIQGDYFLQVVGDSMIGDGIMEGSLAYVKQCNQVSNNSIAVVAIGDDEVTIKRVIQRPEVFILEASNPNVKARYFTYEEVESLPVRIIGKVLYVKTILD